jgi:hypothetical protein
LYEVPDEGTGSGREGQRRDGVGWDDGEVKPFPIHPFVSLTPFTWRYTDASFGYFLLREYATATRDINLGVSPCVSSSFSDNQKWYMVLASPLGGKDAWFTRCWGGYYGGGWGMGWLSLLRSCCHRGTVVAAG